VLNILAKRDYLPGPNFWQNRAMLKFLSRLSYRQSCYCAFCKSERQIYRKRHVSFFNIFASLLGSLTAMMLVWQAFDARVIFIFVSFLATAEVFVQLRWRINMVCKHCGFDPVIYLKDQARAAEKVQAFLKRRKEDPAFLLAKPLNLPPQVKRGGNLSRRA
jgi:hypothetical protein